MKYQAVIFDLFGTLIPMMSSSDYEKVLSQMASVLSVPFDDFVRLWRSTLDQRMKGNFCTHQDCIGHICRQLGVSVEYSQIEAAAQIRFHMNRREVMTLRPDAIDVLSRLKLKGYRIGLISNCAFETTTFWKELPLAPLIDVTIFSCLVGMMKPDPRIYSLATEQQALNYKTVYMLLMEWDKNYQLLHRLECTLSRYLCPVRMSMIDTERNGKGLLYRH